jgi:hypothetical protein
VKYDYAQSWHILLVKVDGGKGMLPHIHENETGIHFVGNGSSSAKLGKETMEYTAGQICSKASSPGIPESYAANEAEVEVYSMDSRKDNRNHAAAS